MVDVDLALDQVDRGNQRGSSIHPTYDIHDYFFRKRPVIHEHYQNDYFIESRQGKVIQTTSIKIYWELVALGR
jgi:hypothetical protein